MDRHKMFFAGTGGSTMSNYITYDEKTGCILSRGVASDGDFPKDVPCLVNVFATPDTHYVQKGRLVEKPPKPAHFFVFDYTVKEWVDPRTPETEWPLVRVERARRLLASDWTQLPDVPLATKEVWASYRQALRDITLQPDPFNIVWPAMPV